MFLATLAYATAMVDGESLIYTATPSPHIIGMLGKKLRSIKKTPMVQHTKPYYTTYLFFSSFNYAYPSKS